MLVGLAISTTNVGNLTRKRTGTSEHAEYYADEQKVILQKGEPLLVDTAKDTARGQKITMWINSDRLVVEGGENKQAQSTIRKK